MKIKENDKKAKFLDLDRELKMLWNMRVTVIPVIISVPVTVFKALVRGLEEFEHRGRTETITKIGQNTEKSHRTLRRFEVINSGIPLEN